jgi:cardiolipin synthase A/B
MNQQLLSSKSFSDPLEIYQNMLQDIGAAKKYIYFETYRFENDPVGIKFRNKLARKAKEGVEVKMILDAWGTKASARFFRHLIREGGEIHFFKKILLTINLFSANHERNHRKLLIIDDEICYLSSINICNYNLNWREFSLRMQGDITQLFKQVFLQSFRIKRTYKLDKTPHTKALKYHNLTIIRDVPGLLKQNHRKKFMQLIKHARQRIIIETPYFIPGGQLIEQLIKASKRGVQVQIYTPLRSDVSLVNILRSRILGRLHEAGMKIKLYAPGNLHAKLILVDDVFYTGTANFDYRSFRYMFEIGLVGDDADIRNQILEHFNESETDCIDFDYEDWKNRRPLFRFFECLLIPFRHFL